jgi:phage I-like protein
MSLVTVPADTALATLIELTAIKLSAETGPASSWVQVAITGDFWHPVHGDLNITKDMLAHMLSNFDSGEYPAPPYQLPVDYEHFSTKKDRKPGDGVAAGWFQKMELREGGNELWALIEWTNPAAAKIRNKEYRFISPTFFREWISNKGRQIGATMVAAALTNIPFLSMHAITLSNDERIATRKPATQRGSGMKIKVKDAEGKEIEIDSESISLDALNQIPAVAELRKKVPTEGTVTVKADDFTALQGKITTLEGSLATLKTTAEANEKRAKDAELQIRKDRLASLKRSGRIDGADETYGNSLIAMENGGPLFDAWYTAMAAKPPKVELAREHGAGGEGDNKEKTDGQKFIELVYAACDKDPSKDFRTVLEGVSLEHPALAKAYRTEDAWKPDYRNAPSIQNVVDRVNVVRGGGAA